MDYPQGGTIKKIPHKSSDLTYAYFGVAGGLFYANAHLSDQHAGGHPNSAYARAYIDGDDKSAYYPNYRYNCWSADAKNRFSIASSEDWRSATITPLG